MPAEHIVADATRGMLRPDIVEIRRALPLLCDLNGVYEIRALDTVKGTVRGYFNDLEKMAEAALACSERLIAPGVYMTLNPVEPNLLARCVNGVEPYAKYTSKDVDVVRRRG